MSWIERYNTAGISQEDRHRLLIERFASVGSGAIVRPPFFCDPGYNVEIGEGAFLNFNCVILDHSRVRIGPQTVIGPGVQILTADHPRDPALRRKHLRSGKPVVVGENVWIGGGAIIVPGVTVGDNAIVGAGSVVVNDVPAGSVVVGNPARVVRLADR
jgi:maltose O-acetyltransferase